jgi:hypothetical protein
MINRIGDASDDLWAVGETNGEALALHYTDPCARNQATGG